MCPTFVLDIDDGMRIMLEQTVSGGATIDGHAIPGRQMSGKGLTMSKQKQPRNQVGERVELRSADGARSELSVLQAKEANAPVLICWPAMGVRQEFYFRLALALQQRGCHVVLADLRGSASSSIRATRSSDFGYRELLNCDYPAVLEQVRARFPASRRLLLGHSLGGQLAALFASTNPGAADGLVLIAACNVHYLGWPFLLRYRVLGTALLFRLLGRALGYVPTKTFGFAGDEARTVIRDWSNNCMTGAYVVTGDERDYEAALRQLQLPVLALSFANDSLAPRDACDRLVQKLAASDLTRQHFAIDHPGLERAAHFDWAKRPDVVADTVQQWLRTTGALAGDARQPAPDRAL
jgi:predicted alpha/beta hydrolase